jgi:hypothetical protein
VKSKAFDWLSVEVIMPGLLNGVRQFVGKQASTFRIGGRVLAASEYDVLADGVSGGVHFMCRGSRLVVVVNADIRKAVAESRLHECSRRWIERAARRSQDIVND